MMKVGIIVQRYGKDVLGGAETLAKNVAEKLSESGFVVTVFTTAAKDYITWKDEFKTGESILKGVLIKRYSVKQERNIEEFNRFSEKFFQTEIKDRDEERWIREQGPYSPDLIEGLKDSEKDIDVFIFFTYLYYTTVEGLKAVSKPAVLFPTAHDELPIHMSLMQDVFKRPDSIFFLTGAEMNFIRQKFNPRKGMDLIRTGVSFSESIKRGLFRNNYTQYFPYILYAGRIEAGKGLETVFNAFREIRKTRLVDLVLIGKKLMDIPDVEGIKYLGYISEEEKLDAFREAILSVQPSPYESLSFTTLESFSQKTPVLVNRKSEVLYEHTLLSKGGLSYENEQELIDGFETIYEDKKLKKKMGIDGYKYLMANFTWDVVVDNIKKSLDRLVKNN